MLMVDGALILAAGILMGRFLPGRRRGAKAAAGPKPVCPCGHHRSFHEGGTGNCAWKGTPEHISFVGTHTPKCECQAYGGPEIHPAFYAPEIGA